ncbi:MAG: hypothetical protein Q8R43_03820 [Alphaproteobacteria bacterium]|nr:hypothetical protein [Alphaproteobacteria bacterium]
MAATCGKALGSIALSEGLGLVRGQVIDRYQKEISEKARGKIKSLFEEPGFKADISKVMRFDGATSSQWKMRQSVYTAMETWEKSNVREVLGIINKVMKILTSTSKSDLTSMLTSVGETMVIGGYNMNVAYTFMDDYIKELRAQVHEVAEGLKNLAAVTKDVCGVKPESVAEWLAALEKEGTIMGNKPYQLVDAARPELGGSNTDPNEAMKESMKAPFIDS